MESNIYLKMRSEVSWRKVDNSFNYFFLLSDEWYFMWWEKVLPTIISLLFDQMDSLIVPSDANESLRLDEGSLETRVSTNHDEDRCKCFFLHNCSIRPSFSFFILEYPLRTRRKA